MYALELNIHSTKVSKCIRDGTTFTLNKKLVKVGHMDKSVSTKRLTIEQTYQSTDI